jgi:hypothetical protein
MHSSCTVVLHAATEKRLRNLGDSNENRNLSMRGGAQARTNNAKYCFSRIIVAYIAKAPSDSSDTDTGGLCPYE